MTSLLGNPAARAAFYTAAQGRAMPHAWLFAGPQGVGKASFARQAALDLLIHAADPSVAISPDAPQSGHNFAKLIEGGAHPDYKLLERLLKNADKPDQGRARSITVDQIRSLQPMFATRPSYSSRRVVIIDAIDDCERSAANALLKNLEEPPAGTIFLLISHAPGRLLPTIRSRCRLLRFDPLDDAMVAQIVRQAQPDASAEEVAAMARAGQGAPGRALAFAGLDLASLEVQMADIARDGDPDNAIRVRLGTTLSTKTAQPRYEAFLERAPSFIAEQARTRRGNALAHALDSYAEARDLARQALRNSLDANITVFAMAGLIARLCEAR